MRAWEFLTESFDQPYPVQMTKAEVDGEPVYHTSVSLPDNTQLDIEFDTFDEEDGNPVWTMEFGRGGSNEITGEGDAMRIFATVVEAIRQFISQEKPYKLGFSARKPFRFPRSRARNKSRSKLYARMVKRFAGQMGYQVDIQDSTIDTDFMLTNPNYQKTDADLTESFDNPYPYRWDAVVPNEIYEVVFNTDSGDTVVVEIEAYDKRLSKWEIGFYRNGEQAVTGEGDAMRIFATVIKIMQEFIQKHKPNSISFSAHKKETESLADKGSRQKLYSRMVKRFAGVMGYNVKERSDIYQSFFTLTKKGLRFKNDFMAESFNQPYPIKVTYDPSMERYEGAAQLPDGSNLRVMAEEYMNIWDVEFDRDYSTELTGGGDAFKIFATVIEGIRQFIKLEKPYEVTFSASKEAGDVQVGNTQSRAKLYDRLVKRFATKMGYNAQIDDYNSITEYTLTNTKRKPVDENAKDGKVKGKSRPGRVKRAGASCKGSVSSLRAKAKKYSGERGKMYHWCANMKAGKKK